MYGWRARIGHVAPSRGDTLVYEFYQMLPAGFMILNSTGTIRQLVDADLERQLQRIEEAAAALLADRVAAPGVDAGRRGRFKCHRRHDVSSFSMR